jgi:hypothetical protein
LQADRTIEFHAAYGRHFTTRVHRLRIYSNHRPDSPFPEASTYSKTAVAALYAWKLRFAPLLHYLSRRCPRLGGRCATMARRASFWWGVPATRCTV